MRCLRSGFIFMVGQAGRASTVLVVATLALVGCTERAPRATARSDLQQIHGLRAARDDVPHAVAGTPPIQLPIQQSPQSAPSSADSDIEIEERLCEASVRVGLYLGDGCLYSVLESEEQQLFRLQSTLFGRSDCQLRRNEIGKKVWQCSCGAQQAPNAVFVEREWEEMRSELCSLLTPDLVSKNDAWSKEPIVDCTIRGTEPTYSRLLLKGTPMPDYYMGITLNGLGRDLACDVYETYPLEKYSTAALRARRLTELREKATLLDIRIRSHVRYAAAKFGVAPAANGWREPLTKSVDLPNAECGQEECTGRILFRPEKEVTEALDSVSFALGEIGKLSQLLFDRWDTVRECSSEVSDQRLCTLWQEQRETLATRFVVTIKIEQLGHLQSRLQRYPDANVVFYEQWFKYDQALQDLFVELKESDGVYSDLTSLWEQVADHLEAREGEKDR